MKTAPDYGEPTRAEQELEGATQALPKPNPLAGVDHSLPTEMRAEWRMLQAQINALLVHGHTVAQQMFELSSRVGRVESRQQDDEAKIASLLTEVEENTRVTKETAAVTSQIRDLITAGRVLKNVGNGAGWLAGLVGKLALAAGAVGGAIAAWVHISGAPK